MAYVLCDVCGKGGFKSKAGLAGHKKIAHGVDMRKTVPDDIGKKLDCLSGNLEVLSWLHFTFMKRFLTVEHGDETLKGLEDVLKGEFGKNEWQDNPVLKGLKFAMKYKGER